MKIKVNIDLREVQDLDMLCSSAPGAPVVQNFDLGSRIGAVCSLDIEGDDLYADVALTVGRAPDVLGFYAAVLMSSSELICLSVGT